MPSKYSINNQHSIYFITFAVVDWVDLLTKYYYKDIVINSLSYCIKNKGLNLYAFVIMSNHIHLIVSASPPYRLSDVIRDFKKFTSKELIRTLINNQQESRQKWLLWLFKAAALKNRNNSKYQVWQQDNRPIELSTNQMMLQRLNYIHMNPVKAQIVFEPEQYIYSSASNYAGLPGVINISYIN